MWFKIVHRYDELKWDEDSCPYISSEDEELGIKEFPDRDIAKKYCAENSFPKTSVFYGHELSRGRLVAIPLQEFNLDSWKESNA